MGSLINEIWAFIAMGDDGVEGIIAMKVGNDWMPLVMADGNKLRQLRPLAETTAKESGKRVTLVKFSTRMDIETV